MTSAEHPPERTRQLVSQLLDGDLSAEEAAELIRLVQADEKGLEYVVDQLLLDSLLSDELGGETLTTLVDLLAGETGIGGDPVDPAGDSRASGRSAAIRSQMTERSAGLAASRDHAAVVPQPLRRRWVSLATAAAAAAVMFVGWWLFSSRTGDAEIVAHFGALQGCRWVDAGTRVVKGKPIHRGQRVELSAGSAEVVFASGAVVTLRGPCIFEVESAKAGFLMLGQIRTLASTPESKGFTVRTRTARVVDVGTEFIASASADGQSRVDVTSGEVLVHLKGIKDPQRLRKGDAFSIEAGSTQVMVRIEGGHATPEFRFSSIEPPSDRDYADAKQGHAAMRLPRDEPKLSANSGLPAVLLDGKGQSQADAPAESVFFPNNVSGMLLLDLGGVVTISKINTYSWHQYSLVASNRIRAAQKYTLYGCASETPPDVQGSLTDAGWVPIARVDSDVFFGVVTRLDRPAQQACSITAAHGTIGRFRYLLWEVHPSRLPDYRTSNNSFYGEFDVYAEAR